MDSVENLRAENARLRGIIESQRDAIKKLNSDIKMHEAKEQSISSAILFAVERSNQWDHSMHKLYELGIQRSRLLYARMERVLHELYDKYPELKKESKLRSMADKFKNIACGGDASYSFDEEHKPKVSEDPIKKLLNNIITYIDDDKKEIRTLTRKQGGVSAVDALANEYSSTPSKSGFDINEALNPTEDLEDILKSFNLKRKSK
ncbi:MAG: hypothetical protein J6Q15_01905 [Clostridia bacterium]|nr:hypothetical protein [Clostridia bacterium]